MITRLVYLPIIVFVKTSILLQYVTIFVVHRRNLFHYGIHILIWVNALFYIAVALQYIFAVSITSKTCVNTVESLTHR